MVKYNKYLKELGLKEDDYPFNIVEGDSRYVEDEDGFKGNEFFSLDYSLSLYIYSQLCYFKENCLFCYPSELTLEQWKDILNKMIEAFKLNKQCIQELKNKKLYLKINKRKSIMDLNYL